MSAIVLEITSGPGAGGMCEFAEPREILLGRDPAADVHLDDSQCSRRHARIRCEPDACLIEDLGSRNGLFVNGRRCAESRLCEGDAIGLGGCVLHVRRLPAGLNREPTVTVRDLPTSVLLTLPPSQAGLLGQTAAPVAAGETQHEIRTLRQLCEISQIVAAEHDLPALLSSIAERIRSILPADNACILTPAGEGSWGVRTGAGPAAAAGNIEVSRTIIHTALREGMAILCANPLQDGRFDPSQSILQQKLTSAICAPIRVRAEPAGLLFVDRRSRRAPFQPMDLRFVATAANLISLLMEREQLELEARRRERLATIGEVMAGLAHCIKNIITGLRFSVDNLRFVCENAKYESAPKCLDALSGQERRISELVLDMLSYAKERVPQREELNLAELLEKVVSPFRHQFEQTGIDLQVVATADGPRIWAEEAALHRVFLNLLTNAMDALAARKPPDAKQIRITVQPRPEAREVEIRFRDSGAGIPPSHLNRIFDVFFSTKGSRGTGLGLAVVSKIIAEHQGRIRVDSCVGAWTEFCITLPVGAAGPAASPPAETRGSPG